MDAYTDADAQQRSPNVKNFYLAGAIIGTLIPYAFFIDFFLSNGLMLPTFLSAVFANSAAGGFTADLLISSFVFWGYLIANQQKRIPLYILLNLTIGLSCALPLYLYFSERDREATDNTNAA